MSRFHRVRRSSIPLLVLCSVILVPAAWAAEEGPPSDCPEPFARVEVTVVPDQEALVVDPESVTVYMQGEGKAHRVCWVVEGLEEGETLHLRRKEGQEDLFPDMERTITPPRTTANSGRPAGTGTWMYGLWITREGSEEQHHVTDPEVIIKDGGD